MENKKYVSAILATALLASQTVSAASMDFGSVANGYASMANDAVESAQDSASSATASDSGNSASDNGDSVVSDSQVHDGNYTVNGDLKVEGVLYVFGNLDVNGDLTIEKDAKLRVTGKLDVNGDLVNNGGSVYSAKKGVTGDNTGKARKIDSLLAEIDPLLSNKLVGEEREGILQDILDSKGIVRSGRLSDFLDSLNDKVEARDEAAFEKVKARLVAALERKIKQQGGLKDVQLDAFQTKLETMPTEKLEKFIDKVGKLEKATKKKRFAFQLAQLKELAEEVVDARSASVDEPTVQVPAPSTTDSSTSASTSSGTTASTGSGSASTTTGSGTSATTSSGSASTSSGSTASGSTVTQ